MCGFFGIISPSFIKKNDLKILVNHSLQRGVDKSGFIYLDNNQYKVKRADYSIRKLLDNTNFFNSGLVIGYSSSISNGITDNQPVVRNKISAIHNGIILNEDEVWSELNVERKLKIDSEVIVAIAEEFLEISDDVEKLPQFIFDKCKGIVSCVLVLPEKGKLLLFSNNGSLYIGKKEDLHYFSTESYGLNKVGCQEIKKLVNDFIILDIPVSDRKFEVEDKKERPDNLIPKFHIDHCEEKLLEFNKPNLRRCTKCVLPETMPFIKFDNEGVCNYCKNYKIRNSPKPKEELFKIVESYRRPGDELDCIVPFSGGRDSCYGLHLIVKELKMKPVTYTYDWGMVTDLGRRNISLFCAELGVENITVAADISKKRKNIKMNLEAWLKSPHLGLMGLMTAGDKHFFRHVEDIKKQTGVDLNLWGVNPLEVTHFKTGFLGIKPDFEEKRVYNDGVLKQIRYHAKRFRAMMQSPGFYNSSLWDTLSGEYFRSFTKKKDYFHIFDYWRWDEDIVNAQLDEYGWEKASDTTTTWRIGDGTAAFYNYVYYTIAGFTEHDTFRSNQIREGQLSREKALQLIEDENRPRYENIRWYLDTLGFDFEHVIKIINSVPKLY